MILGSLELVFYGDDLDLGTGLLQVIVNRAEVRRPLPFKVQEWKDADFAGYPEHFLKSCDVESQVKMLGVEKQEVRNEEGHQEGVIATGVAKNLEGEGHESPISMVVEETNRIETATR